MKPRLLILVLTLSTAFAATAQQSSLLAEDNLEPHTLRMLTSRPPSQRDLVAGCRHLALEVDANAFFLDSERQMNQVKGYTVTGFRLSPTLTYGINERAQLRIGLNATAFAGLDSLYRLRPTFSLVYAPTRWLTLIGGTICGSHTHQLAPIVYDPARWIFNYQEDGLQILTDTKIWRSDTWLDWTRYLTPWTPDQERFTMGTSHTLLLFNNVKEYTVRDFESGEINDLKIKGWRIELPVHFIACHRGGEVKTIDTNTVTVFNERVGLRFARHFSRNPRRSLNKLALDISVYQYHLEDRNVDRPGQAFNPTLSYEWLHFSKYQQPDWNLRAVAGFVHSNNYFSALGDPAYWNFSPYSALHIPNAKIPENSWLNNYFTFGLSAAHEFKGLDLGLQFNVINDLDVHDTDLFIGFFMRFNERFILF